MKTAVVTGASTGIGKEVAIKLGQIGYKVLLVARREEKLLETKSSIEMVGGFADIKVTDLSNLESTNNLIDYIKGTYKNIDTLINVAGVWHDENNVFANKNFEDFSQEIILNTLNVGITAPTLLSHACIPLMRKGSSIVNISGTFENGAKGWLPYYLSKKAIEDLTIGLAEELKDKEIYVNCISPSDTSTEEYAKFFPEHINESISPSDAARAVLDISQSKDSGVIKVVKK